MRARLDEVLPNPKTCVRPSPDPPRPGTDVFPLGPGPLKLLAIIINYKTAEMTVEAIDAFLRECGAYPDARAVVVDNDSQDGSFETLSRVVAERGWSDRVDVLASPWNGGFAWGVNFGVRHGLSLEDVPEYFYLLNSDAFPDEGAIEKLVGYLDTHDEFGIAGSYIHGTGGAENDPHTTAFRFPSVASEFEATLGFGLVSKLLANKVVSPPLPTVNTPVGWLAGASMLIRREVFENVGLFDDGFFLYFEETDFCLRAARAGYPTVYVRESEVTHIGSVSTGYQDRSRPTPTYWYASRHRYFLKNHGRGTLWLANLVYIVGGLLRRVRYAIIRRPSHEPKKHMRHFLRFNLWPGRKPDVHPPGRPSNGPMPSSGSPIAPIQGTP